MGKGKRSDGKASGAAASSSSSKFHVSSKARECTERKDDLKKRIELKRLRSIIDKLKDELAGNVKVEVKIDPLYDLRGAARPARAFYTDPNAVAIAPPVNHFEKDRGNLWAVAKGQELLKTMMSFAHTSLDSLGRTLDAISTFQEMLQFDCEDHLNVKEELLVLYCQRRDWKQISELVDRFPEERGALFAYLRLLSVLKSGKGKKDGNAKQVSALFEAALQANRYLAFALAYESIFDQVIEHLDRLDGDLREQLDQPGSVEEAFLCFQEMHTLWRDADSATAWLVDSVQSVRLPIPLATPGQASTSRTAPQDSAAWTADDWHGMYEEMFHTGMSMATS